MTNDDEKTLNYIRDTYTPGYQNRGAMYFASERFFQLECQYLLGELERNPEQRKANMVNINKFIAKLTRLIENKTQYGHHELAESCRQLLNIVLSNSEIKRWKGSRKQRKIDRSNAKWEKYKRKHGIIECP